MATAEELELSREIRREFSKRPIDSTRLEITVIRGRIYLSGTLSTYREEHGIIVKNEVAEIVQRVSKMHGVKQVIVEAKMNEEKKRVLPNHEHGPGHH